MLCIKVVVHHSFVIDNILNLRSFMMPNAHYKVRRGEVKRITSNGLFLIHFN
jgi:hypothetical protein